MFIYIGRKPDNSNQIDDGNESDNGSIASSVSTAFSDESDRYDVQSKLYY